MLRRTSSPDGPDEVASLLGISRDRAEALLAALPVISAKREQRKKSRSGALNSSDTAAMAARALGSDSATTKEHLS